MLICINRKGNSLKHSFKPGILRMYHSLVFWMEISNISI